MKVIALLSWYDEDPNWLAATVSSLRDLCDHVVAVDGAYALFPGARNASGVEQAEAVVDVARSCGLGVTLHVPATYWIGNEVEKRNHSVQLALTIAQMNIDWLFRIDADERVEQTPGYARDRLAASRWDAAAVTLVTKDYANDTRGVQGPMRWLMRVRPEMGVRGAHYLYTARNPEPFCYQDIPCADMHDLRIEHRHEQRSAERNRRAAHYYSQRDAIGLEHAYDLEMPG